MPVDADLAMAIDALQRRRISENAPIERGPRFLAPWLRRGLGAVNPALSAGLAMRGIPGVEIPETPPPKLELPPNPADVQLRADLGSRMFGPDYGGNEELDFATTLRQYDAEPSGVKNAPPQEEPGYIRYSMGGPVGPRETGTAFGQSYTKPMAPDPSTFREFRGGTGGGAVSMMTAPENAERVTYASRMEDLGRQMQEQFARKTLEDPLWQERAKQQSRAEADILTQRGKTMAEVEAGRAVRGDYSSEKAFLQQKAAEAIAGAAGLPPDQRAARIAEITAKREQLEADLDKAFGFSQRTGGAGVFGTGQGDFGVGR